jgi:hypothetical protein
MSRSSWKRAGSRLLGLILALVAIELIVRQVYSASVLLDPLEGAVVEPGTRVVWSIEGRGVSHWYAGSIRTSGTDRRLPRILVLGDSFTESVMSDDDKVFTARLERMLDGAGLKTSVVNRGRSGTSSADYVALAPKLVREYSPLWTVIQLRDDDLMEDAWDHRKPYFERAGRGLRVVFPERHFGLAARLLQRTNRLSMALAYAIRFRITDFREAFSHEPPLFRAGSAPPAAAPKPRAADYPIAEELDAMRRGYANRVTFLYLSDLDYADPRRKTEAEERFEAYCRESGASCVSFRPEYPRLAQAGISPFGFANTRFNFGHMNDEGQRLAATILLREMETLHHRGLL